MGLLFRGEGCVAAGPAALVLAVSILCPASAAIGDGRVERSHQLFFEVGTSLRDGNVERAASLLEEIVRLEREAGETDDLRLAEALAQLAEIRILQQDLDGAEAVLLEAHERFSERVGPLNPISGYIIAVLAGIYTARGDLTKGAVAMDRAVALTPPVDARSAHVYASVYQAAGEWEKARRILELAARLAPDDPVISNDLAWVLLSSPRAGPAEFQRAEQLARSSLEARPDNVAVMDTLGWALVLVGRHAEAREVLQKALEAPPQSLGAARAVVEFHAALAHERGGDPVGAVALAQSSVDGAVPGLLDSALAKDLLARLTSRLPEHSGRLDDVR